MKDLVAASATPMVLGTLVQGESYGCAIIKQVDVLSGGELAWIDGLLYPLLHRLERQGHVEPQWRTHMRSRRAVLDTDVDELKDHLRDTVGELDDPGTFYLRNIGLFALAATGGPTASGWTSSDSPGNG